MSALCVEKIPRTHLAKRFQISHSLPLKLTQILIDSSLNQPRVGSPVEREKRLSVRKVHHVPTSLSTTDTHKSIFVIFIRGAIQAEQTPIRLTTQGNSRVGKTATEGSDISRPKQTNSKALIKDQLLGLSWVGAMLRALSMDI
jgi:hypothetical protein